MNAAQLSDQVLRRLPAILEARRVAAEEAIARRRDLLRAVEAEELRFEAADAALEAKAKPIAQRLAALRAELEQLEGQIMPIHAARDAARSTRQMQLQHIRAQLRQIAQSDLEAFQIVVDNLRSEISNNSTGRRDQILRRFRPDQALHQRIAEAMSLVLEGFRQAQRATLEVDDFSAAIDRIRRDIQAAGIEFLED